MCACCGVGWPWCSTKSHRRCGTQQVASPSYNTSSTFDALTPPIRPNCMEVDTEWLTCMLTKRMTKLPSPRCWVVPGGSGKTKEGGIAWHTRLAGSLEICISRWRWPCQIERGDPLRYDTVENSGDPPHAGRGKWPIPPRFCPVRAGGEVLGS
jgi:hypothetical protein